jgi:peptidoglycan hydrolase-like protein with peptidoglycan-binding domain
MARPHMTAGADDMAPAVGWGTPGDGDRGGFDRREDEGGGPDGEGDGESPDAAVELGPPRRRRRLVLGAAALAAVTAVGAVIALRRGSGTDDTPSELTGPTATAPVEVRTLTEVEEVDGTLDFGEPRGVAAGAAGTVTSVAAEGTTVERGGNLFSIDQHPTVLLTGAIPLYRDLAEGTGDGTDVAQLEDNLAALGYTADGGLVVDEHFDAATTAAVEAWQEDRGVEVTGRVTRTDAVFLPGPARIASTSVDVGATVQAGATVLEYTGSNRFVRAEIDPSQADLVHRDDKVTITLPDGTEVAGTVATVAAASSSSSSSGSGGEGAASGTGGEGSTGSSTEDAAMIEVGITLDDPAPAEPYTSASVEIELTGRQREDVLAVPVTALVAVPGSGYALEVPQEDGTTEMVEVDPGMYADGYVEVSGDGIAEGTEVVVAEP